MRNDIWANRARAYRRGQKKNAKRAQAKDATNTGRANQTQVGGNTVAANSNVPASPVKIKCLLGHMFSIALDVNPA